MSLILQVQVVRKSTLRTYLVHSKNVNVMVGVTGKVRSATKKIGLNLWEIQPVQNLTMVMAICGNI